MRTLFLVAALGAGVYILLLTVTLYRVESFANLKPEGSKLRMTPTKIQPVQTKQIPRFPEYGTPRHSHQCGWAAYGNTNTTRSCTFLVRPYADLNEGISLWLSLIAQAHQIAQQANCNLVFDYGENMNLSSVLIPNSSWNWTVPQDFECRQEHSCFQWHPPYNYKRIRLEQIVEQLNTSIAYVPLYRHAYSFSDHSKHLQLFKDDFEGMERNVPGFQPETGMACSLSELFRLSPSASQFEPTLFTKILPAMHRHDALVISLYIRTGQADVSANREMEHDPHAFVENKSYLNQTQDILSCALQLENEYHTVFSKVIWIVVTDSLKLKQWIAQSYTTDKRKVLTTTSRGAHTKVTRDPSLVDFAEAMVDWYLIGEADVVIMDHMSVSFGGTAAMRTARTVYDASTTQSKSGCQKAIPIHKGRSSKVL